MIKKNDQKKNKKYSNAQIVEFVSKGKLYNPSYLHYGDQNIVVSCNQCGKGDLQVSYGYAVNVDLCMECVNKAINKIQNEQKNVAKKQNEHQKDSPKKQNDSPKTQNDQKKQSDSPKIQNEQKKQNDSPKIQNEQKKCCKKTKWTSKRFPKKTTWTKNVTKDPKIQEDIKKGNGSTSKVYRI